MRDKIRCDCRCSGPFCSDLIHPCQKPDEHYPQREDAIRDIRKEFFENIIKERDQLWKNFDNENNSREYKHGYINGMNYLLDSIKKYL